MREERGEFGFLALPWPTQPEISGYRPACCNAHSELPYQSYVGMGLGRGL